jgi:hypothetical protein
MCVDTRADACENMCVDTCEDACAYTCEYMRADTCEDTCHVHPPPLGASVLEPGFNLQNRTRGFIKTVHGRERDRFSVVGETES